jgi:hypothetical protein
MNQLVFRVMTPLGFLVEANVIQWGRIVGLKHPVMLGRENDVAGALEHPDLVRVSLKDPTVYLFYREERPGRWTCAVAKDRKDGTGFLITCFPTDAVKKGDQIWPS